jgi:hypothetical protein
MVLDLQLPVQSVLIATNLCDQVCQWLVTGLCFLLVLRFPPPINKMRIILKLFPIGSYILVLNISYGRFWLIQKKNQNLARIRKTSRIKLFNIRSLKGDAARIVMRLGADINLETLLHKLESAYGISFQDDLLMREFYDAQQKTDEAVYDCRCWFHRVERGCNRHYFTHWFLMIIESSQHQSTFTFAIYAGG